ncbi:MAG: hypothetical protein PHU63_02290 [Candidatus ainarchaeum sp.]|nr:hypothetical protein [Candidatus ainarchaeum sp.]
MEIKNKKVSTDVSKFMENKEEEVFSPEKILLTDTDPIKIPEMMKQDLKKMEMFSKREWKK